MSSEKRSSAAGSTQGATEAKALHELLHYDDETGFLYWKPRTEQMFEGKRQTAACWNRHWAHGRADRAGNRAGYLRVTIFGRTYYAHRVVWAIKKGDWPGPKDHIDHIDKDKTNNKISNLRCVSASINHRNTKRQANNTSGQTGVCWNKENDKWTAYIKTNGKTKHLGYFDGFLEAKRVRKRAEKKLGFSQLHGGSK